MPDKKKVFIFSSRRFWGKSFRYETEVGSESRGTEQIDPADHIEDNSGLLELKTTTHDQPGISRVFHKPGSDIPP